MQSGEGVAHDREEGATSCHHLLNEREITPHTHTHTQCIASVCISVWHIVNHVLLLCSCERSMYVLPVYPSDMLPVLLEEVFIVRDAVHPWFYVTKSCHNVSCIMACC